MYTHGQTLRLSVPPALFCGFSFVLECKAAIEGLAVDSRSPSYYSCSHEEVCITYQIGMLDAQPS